jgi:hypothetical protein
MTAAGIVANAMRGEVAVAIDGRACLLRPTFAALVAAEAELGSLVALIERAADGGLRLDELIAVLWHCLAEPAAFAGRDSFADAALAAGLVRLTPAVRTVFAQVLAGR